jgi:hypothetical protein
MEIREYPILRNGNPHLVKGMDKWDDKHVLGMIMHARYKKQ